MYKVSALDIMYVLIVWQIDITLTEWINYSRKLGYYLILLER